MEATIKESLIHFPSEKGSLSIEQIQYKNDLQLGKLHRRFIWAMIKLKIFYLVCITLRSPALIIKTYRRLISLRTYVWGGQLNKLYKISGKYYYSQYAPGWPSKLYDKLIISELKRQANFSETVREKLSFVFFAITRKCPMRCEHCFEWDNLNQKESFTSEDLLKVVDVYQKEGVMQIHFSGGEPMVRFQDLLKVVQFASPKCETWVLTSGFNLTKENALLLKSEGLAGVVVSIDHYIPELHNIFRGHKNAFEGAVAAVKNAQAAGLVIAISVCATKAFLDGGHLEYYMQFAKELGVQFVQVLEPRMVGHYENQPVLLEEKHIVALEKQFRKFNYDPSYVHFPIMVYHGFHQRRVGCYAGSRSIYIDSTGDVHACPFCHTKSYNIIDLIRSKAKQIPIKENACPQFNTIA